MTTEQRHEEYTKAINQTQVQIEALEVKIAKEIANVEFWSMTLVLSAVSAACCVVVWFCNRQ